MNDYTITLSGAFAYITIAIWVILALTGFSLVLIGAYRIWDYAFRQTLTYFKINNLFREFMWKKLNKRPPSNRMSEEESDELKQRLAHNKP